MTAQERHYRDLLNSVKARLRQMEANTSHSQAARTEARQIADMIAARIDGTPRKEAE